MSYSPHFFGPAFWKTMHIMAATATTDRKRQLYINWLNSLTEILPCEKCRLHFIKNLKDNPVEPHSKTNVSLFFHSWQLHDTVNKQILKLPQNMLSYEEAFNKYFPKAKALQSRPDDTTPVRNMVFSSRNTDIPINKSDDSSCSGDCGAPTYEEITKTDFKSFRKMQKKRFASKNI